MQAHKSLVAPSVEQRAMSQRLATLAPLSTVPSILRQLHSTWIALVIIVSVTVGVTMRLLLSTTQFIGADMHPFSVYLLQACLQPYENAGLGRENPSASPSLCL